MLKKPQVVVQLRCEKFFVACCRLCQPPLPCLSMVPFSQTYVFRVFQKISKGLNTSLIVSMVRTATSVTKNHAGLGDIDFSDQGLERVLKFADETKKSNDL